MKLKKEYEERNKQLKEKYNEREKNLDYKEHYLEKYKNDIDISVQRMKFNEELNSVKDSILNTDKNNKKDYNEKNIIINNEIGLLKKEIEEVKNNYINIQPYLKNNFIKNEEDKKNYNINNNVKPSKESVINSLNQLAKNNNNNLLNKSKSSNSPSGSGVYNNNKPQHNKKDRRKRLEELEQEEYELNHQMREEFKKIINGDLPIFNMDKD